MTTTGLNRGEIIDRVMPYIASGSVSKNLVGIPNGFVASGDFIGQLQVKLADVAGTTRPLGIFESDQTTGKVVCVKSKGLLKGVSSAAINENVPVTYTATGKLKTAATGEIICGFSRSKCTAADEEILVEWTESYIVSP